MVSKTLPNGHTLYVGTNAERAGVPLTTGTEYIETDTLIRFIVHNGAWILKGDNMNQIELAWVEAAQVIVPNPSNIASMAGEVDATKYTINGVDALDMPASTDTLVGDAGGGTGFAGTAITAVGKWAGYKNTQNNLTAVGVYAGRDNVGGNCSLLGYSAGRSNSGILTAFGYNAGFLNTGTPVLAFGDGAAYENEGNYVVALGNESAKDNSGDEIVAIGAQAGRANQSDKSVMIGANAGNFCTATVGVTAIGHYAGKSNTHDGVIALGRGAKPTKANQMIVGGLEQFHISYINALTVVSGTSGGAFEGLGASSTTDGQAMGRIGWSWNVSTHASRSADIVLYASDYGGEREIVRGRGSGTEAALGFYGVTPTARQVLATGGGATVDNVISALQTLGLVKQS